MLTPLAKKQKHFQHRLPTISSLENGLGQTGNVPIPIDLWHQLNLPLHLPQHPPLPSPTPAPPSISSALPNFLHTLCSTAVIDLPTTSLNAAPAFLSYKSEHKLRFIIDFRAYNLAFPKPPPFSLPNLAHLLALRQFNQLFFIKIDLLNCFWSIRLPDTVGGEFCGNLYSTTFTTRRLPFGWSWSPVLAQLTIHSYFNPSACLPHLFGNTWTTS